MYAPMYYMCSECMGILIYMARDIRVYVLVYT